MPEIIVKPEPSRVDEIVYIQIKNLSPEEHVLLQVTATDATGQVWRSEEQYRANAHGEIDLIEFDHHLQCIWSMTPQNTELPKTTFCVKSAEPLTFKISVLSRGQLVVEKTMQRAWHLKELTINEVDESHVKGILVKPKNTAASSAVVLVPGTGGPYTLLPRALLLADQGYAVFIAAYYAFKDLPAELYEIPLERICDAINWLSAQSDVQNEVAVYGFAKGAEAALATAAYFPELPIKKIIAVSPSSVIWQGVGRGRPQDKSSWSLAGEPLPFLAFDKGVMWREIIWRSVLGVIGADKAWRFVKAYRAALHANDNNGARIPVEKIAAPMLLISGDDDQLWPSSQMARDIRDARVDHTTWRDYKDAGHLISFPYLPTTVSQMTFAKLVLEFGGNAAGNAHANREAWREVLAFLG